MTTAQFISHIEKTYIRGLDIIKSKNADYAGSSDPWKNFRSAEVVGVSLERAILVRILDKLARVGNLLGKENQVKDESIEDTILDAANYLLILHAYLYGEKGKNSVE